MPNVKIFVDQTVFEQRGSAIKAMLPLLRESLCTELSVPIAACQLAVLPVLGMPDQPQVNMEVQYLGTAERTPEMIHAACKVFSDVIAPAVESMPAIRATPLDPATYVALK